MTAKSVWAGLPPCQRSWLPGRGLVVVGCVAGQGSVPLFSILAPNTYCTPDMDEGKFTPFVQPIDR